MKQHEFVRKSYYILKIDTKIWYEIKKFISSNYNKMSITIEREDSVDVLDGMDLAYTLIKDHTEQIRKIIILACNDNESVELILNTRRMGARHSMLFRARHTGAERGNELKIIANNLVLRTRVSTNLIRISAVFYFYSILIHAMEIVTLKLMSLWLALATLIVMACFGVLLDFYIYSPVLEDFIYGKDRVQFWVDNERITKYKKRQKRGRILGGILIAIASVILFFVAFK